MRRRKINPDELDDRVLLANLYLTQGLVLGLALLLIWWRNISPAGLFAVESGRFLSVAGLGASCAALVLGADYLLGKLAPGQMTDDGGINEKLFAKRPIWHIAVICLVVAFCEELLFRGALQQMMGNYWTSVLFAAIHVRYLRHWLPTLAVFAAGYALGWINEAAGSLAAPVLAHFLIDFANGYRLRRKTGND